MKLLKVTAGAKALFAALACAGAMLASAATKQDVPDALAVPAGQKLEIEPGWIIGGARYLTGCVLGSNRFRIDAPRYVEYYRQGRLNLDEMVTRHCRLEEIDEAFKEMENGDLVRSVVMFD